MNPNETSEEKKWVQQIAGFDRAALARAITLIESSREEDQRRASVLLSLLPPVPLPAFRLGITGAPGSGKSTLIDSLGVELCGRGRRVAVLAVDPSSSVTGGSILGDRTRMERLGRHPNAYVRTSPSRCVPGGIGATTDPSIRLCEAAGCDFILVETVGSGQAETCVAMVADAVLLLIDPGGGDGIQALKKGILEVADFICISKGDGERRDDAEATFHAFSGSFPQRELRLPGHSSSVMLTSAKDGELLLELAEAILAFEEAALPMLSGWRREQAERDFMAAIQSVGIKEILAHPVVAGAAEEYLASGNLRPHPVDAARRALRSMLGCL